MHAAIDWTRDWVRTGDVAIDVECLLCLHGHPHTAAHSKRVAQEAQRLAKRFYIDEDAARTAGYLHDISAIFPNQLRVEIARAADIEVLPEEEAFPMIIHQKLSLVMARDLFFITDPHVLSAIGCHTTLKASASPLDLALFVADKIEWDQSGTPPYYGELVSAADHSLKSAALVYLSYMWERREHLRVVHPWLKEAYVELSRSHK